MNTIILFLIIFTITMISFIFGFIYHIKLIKYLQKNKPKILDKVVMKKERYVIEKDKSFENKMYKFSFKHLYPKLPIFMKLDITFYNYLFSKDKEDDNKSKLYKRLLAVSLVVFIVGLITLFFIPQG